MSTPAPDLAEVLRRWNPGALDTVVPDDGPPCVSVLGLRGTGRGDLVALLRAVTPGMRFAEQPDPQCAVALMVLDAASPLGREELAVLQSGSAEARAVSFALTRIDAHGGGEAVRLRDAALIAEHAPRFAGAAIHPISVRDGSGLAALRAELVAALADDRDGPGAVTHRRVHAATIRTRELVRSAATGLFDEDGTAALRAQRVALIADRDGGRAESAGTLRRLTALARVDLMHDVGDRVRSLAVVARSTIDRGDRSGLTRYPEWLRAEVVALTADLDELTSDRLGRVGAQVLAPQTPGPIPTVVAPNRAPPTVDEPERRHRGVEDRMMILVGASAGLGLGRLVMAPMATVPAMDVASIPVTLLIGGLAAWWLTRARGHLADRNHLRQWMTETLAQVRAALEQRALGRLVDTEAAVAERVLVAHRRRVLDVEELLAGLDRRLRERVTRTSGRLAACERDLAVLDRYLAGGRAEPSVDGLRPIP